MLPFLKKSANEIIPEGWDLDTIVMNLEGTDYRGISGHFPFSIRDAVEGVLGLGSPGSGKSSGVLNSIFDAYLKHHFGFVIMTVKPGDKKEYIKRIQKAGREKDLVVFSPTSGHRFDPIAYEYSRMPEGAKDVSKIVEILERVNALSNPGGSGLEDGGFWENAKNMLSNAGFRLLLLSGEEPSIENIKELIVTANSSDGIISQFMDLTEALRDSRVTEEERKQLYEEIENLANRNYLISCLIRAEGNSTGNPEKHREFKNASGYFLRQYPQLADKTRSAITQTLLGMAENLNGTIINRCFTGGISEELRPEKTFQEGKIILLDFNVQEYGMIGKLSQALYRANWMNEMLRRDCDHSPAHRPVALIADEYQSVLFPGLEESFANRSRSCRAAIVGVTQNINAIHMAFSGSNSEHKAKNFMACYNTAIFCSNSCSDTNKYSSEKIMETLVERKSRCVSKDSKTESFNQEKRPQVEPIEFTRLRTGGKRNDYKVDAFVVKASKHKEWHGGNFIRATFDQS